MHLDLTEILLQNRGIIHCILRKLLSIGFFFWDDIIWNDCPLVVLIIHGFRSVWIGSCRTTLLRISVVGGVGISEDVKKVDMIASSFAIGLVGLGSFCFEVFFIWEFLDLLNSGDSDFILSLATYRL